jgi:hypothetical protein
VERAALVPRAEKIRVVLQGREIQTDIAIVENILKEFHLSHCEISWIEKMPLDHRHDWKIDRAKLSALQDLTQS